MTRSLSSRWWLAVAVVLGCLLWAFGGAASAARSFNTATDRSIVLDGNAHWWQQGGTDRSKVVTHGGYQYISSWDHEDAEGNVFLVVSRRRLSDDDIDSITFNREEDGEYGNLGHAVYPESILDPHDTTALGVSSQDGRLHVTWTYHSSELRYAISEEGCLSQSDFEDCRFTWQEQIGENEESATYSGFFTHPDGTLFSTYRDGSNTSGNQIVNQYQDNGEWDRVGPVLEGLTGEFRGARVRGPYPDGFKFDANGRLHLMWTWRENRAGDWGVKQHDVYYAYSDNLGETWRDNDGTIVADMSERDAITVTDAETMAWEEPSEWWRPNGGRMVLDSNGQPHLIIPLSDVRTANALETNFRLSHYWRTMDGAWHQGWVEPTEQGVRFQVMGSLVFDRADTAYYVYARHNLGWEPYDDGTPIYNEDNRADYVTWQEREYLHMVPFNVTSILTTERIGTTIATGARTDNRNIEIRIRNSTDATDGLINFITDADRGWERWRSTERVAFRVENNGAWQTVAVPMREVATWSGTLRALELYPAREATTGSIDIDYIRIQNDERRVAKAWEFRAGTELRVAEAAASDGWRSWEIYPLLPAETNLAWYDATSFGIDETRYDQERFVNFTLLEQAEPGFESFTLREFDIEGDNYVKFWNFADDAMGWTAPRDATVSWSSSGNGLLRGSITGRDSQLLSADRLRESIPTGRSVRIQMKQSAGSRARFCYRVNEGATFTCQTFTVTPDNALHVYELRTEGWANWRGQELTQVRLEPSDNSEVVRGTFEVDYVRILD